MDCGAAGDLLCRVSGWLYELGIDVTQWTPTFRQLGNGLSEFFWRIVELAQAHGEKLFGLAGFSFGVWRWWYYRESVLHKRLQEYLAEQDRRLRQARSDVIEAILRPGPKRQFTDPLFAVGPLRRVLRRRRWNALIGVGTAETQADRSLNRALREVERRLGIAVGALTSLRSQMASAYLLKGAIASARASRARDVATRIDLDDRALIQFRTVLQVHDYERDAQAKEYEAHQLRRLGHLTEAENAYEQLEDLAAWIADDKERKLLLARARRYRAQIAQARAPGGSTNARDLIVEAKNLRSEFAPFRDWESIEQGDLHYVEAFIRSRLHNHHQIEQQQLSLAETSYGNVLLHTPKSRWFFGGGTRRIRATARAGVERVRRARERCNYEVEWLLPGSNNSEQPPSAVGNTGGQ